MPPWTCVATPLLRTAISKKLSRRSSMLFILLSEGVDGSLCIEITADNRGFIGFKQKITVSSRMPMNNENVEICVS